MCTSFATLWQLILWTPVAIFYPERQLHKPPIPQKKQDDGCQPVDGVPLYIAPPQLPATTPTTDICQAMLIFDGVLLYWPFLTCWTQLHNSQARSNIEWR